ncbi:hypothetical protein, partial [Bacteroides acidifaciens]|uniref:hypothetical protein n=1 Tax=Bacteroides acidifaciens TaxID=85831 RepID=UPI0026261950
NKKSTTLRLTMIFKQPLNQIKHYEAKQTLNQSVCRIKRLVCINSASMHMNNVFLLQHFG